VILFKVITPICQRALIILTTVGALSACANHQPLEGVDFVDKQRFEGEWYVIANIPYFAERNKVGSKTTYVHRKGRLFDDIFEAHDKTFDSDLKKIVGTVKSLNEKNNEWRSTFYWFIRFKFSVVHVNPEYDLMLLGHSSRKYGWVMARNKRISNSEYQRSMNIFEQLGYDIKQFSKVPQLPNQIGQPGFQ